MDEKKVREAIDRITDLIELMPAIDTCAIGYLKTAIKALEKQLPKKVEYEGGFSNNGFARYRMAKCPTCDRRYSNNDEVVYCSNCGQRVDW